MPYVEKLSGSARSVVFSGKSGSDLVSVFSGDGKKPYDNHRGRQHHDARGLGDRAHRQPRVERDTDRCPVRQGDLGEAQCIQEIVRHVSSRYVRNRIQEEPPTVTPEGGIVKRVEIASSAEYSPCVIRGYERRTSERHFRGIQNLNSTHIIRDKVRSNCCKIGITSFRPSSAEAQVARVRASGEKQTPAMELACPLRVASSARDFRSQRRTSISLPPEASVRPSGEKVTEVTSPALP